MLTLLRKVRRSLVASNQFRKYLLYAIGEIALVVIGILIALQINNWNQDRINNKTEKDILERIIADLEIDLSELAISGQFNEQRIIRGVWVLQQLGEDVDEIRTWDIYSKAIRNPENDAIEMGTFGRALMAIRFYFLFEESNITIQEITATGKLDIIKDGDVRIAIQAHYAYVDRLQYLQRLLLLNRDEFVEYLLDNEVSILNNLTLEEVLDKVGNHKKLAARIKNFLDATRATYNRVSGAYDTMLDDNIIRDDDSIKKRTQVLIGRIQHYLGEF